MEQALVEEHGPGVPDPDCTACDIATVHRIVEQGARMRNASAHAEVMRAAGVGSAEYASVLQALRQEAMERLPARACMHHLLAGAAGAGA